ncbi:FAD-dependent oxidoreductase [Rhodohalobacter sp. SW132]|uniref:NAD(P)/FAD-dependent oxidoreductase n=1 Tax=Rhodohalobacter sp. SW132 TaxID=2293433 RepID=UPI000E2309A5|nr:FAD-dependent oxidoreductase [Rhodohalobacter sp. SW132]REL38023.1 FAD-dependent oxidoreductase [Rhodohalobacter sp. SW132]
MESNRVIIIGAGIAGLFTAYYLNRRGLEVTILDKDTGKDNCSYGNAGMIVPSHIIPLSSPGIISKGLKWMLEPESPFYIRPRLSLDLLKWGWEFKKASTDEHVKQAGPVLRDLLMASRELLIDFESEENSSFGYEKRGLLMFCNTEKGLKKEVEAAEIAQQLGVPAEVLTADQVKEMEPDLNLNIIGATYYPKDAHLHPGSLMDSLKELLVSRGVTFHWNTEIEKMDQSGGKIRTLHSSDGKEWKADTYILCAGAWSAGIAKKFGTQMLMQAGKGYSITIEEPVKRPLNCGIFAERKVTMTPMFGSLRFAGTMEIVGTDTRINRAKMNGLKKSVCEYLPEFSMNDLEGHPVWTGLRPCSPDGMPYVGTVSSLKNVYASTGHAMMGMSLAPSCGKIVADLITEGKSDLNHSLINPNRFAG